MSELEWLQRNLVAAGLLSAERLAGWLRDRDPEVPVLKHLIARGVLDPATARTVSAVIQGYVRMEPAMVLGMFRQPEVTADPAPETAVEPPPAPPVRAATRPLEPVPRDMSRRSALHAHREPEDRATISTIPERGVPTPFPRDRQAPAAPAAPGLRTSATAPRPTSRRATPPRDPAALDAANVPTVQDPPVRAPAVESPTARTTSTRDPIESPTARTTSTRVPAESPAARTTSTRVPVESPATRTTSTRDPVEVPTARTTSTRDPAASPAARTTSTRDPAASSTRLRPAIASASASSPALRAAVDVALSRGPDGPRWPAAGEHLAGFDLQVLLRSGPEQALYRARIGDRRVLLKLQRADAAATQQAAYTRLGYPASDARPGAATPRTGHPAIVPLLAAGLAAGLGYLVFDDPAGPGLDEYVARTGPLPADRVLRVGIEAAQALTAAARLGVLHGDLGPERILVCSSDARVELLDFMAPVARASLTDPPLHRAPEHEPGAPPTPQADMYSLGVALHHAATGHPPAGPGLRAPLPGLPHALSAVLARLLQPRPARRPVAWDEVVTALLATRKSARGNDMSSGTDGDDAR